MSRPALTKPLSDAQVRAILDAYQRPEFRVEGQRNALYALQYQGLVRRVAMWGGDRWWELTDDGADLAWSWYNPGEVRHAEQIGDQE